jgi:hypothetical protein
MMITELCRDYLTHLAKLSETGLQPASPEGKVFIKSMGKRAVELSSLFANSWVKKETGCGVYTLYPVDQIAEGDDTQRLIDQGYLLIGSAGNGDLLVVSLTSKDLLECPIGLVSHEDFWGSDLRAQECLAPVCPNLLDLLYRAVEEKYLPLDYFVAIEHNKAKESFMKA